MRSAGPHLIDYVHQLFHKDLVRSPTEAQLEAASGENTQLKQQIKTYEASKRQQEANITTFQEHLTELVLADGVLAVSGKIGNGPSTCGRLCACRITGPRLLVCFGFINQLPLFELSGASRSKVRSTPPRTTSPPSKAMCPSSRASSGTPRPSWRHLDLLGLVVGDGDLDGIAPVDDVDDGHSLAGGGVLAGGDVDGADDAGDLGFDLRVHALGPVLVHQLLLLLDLQAQGLQLQVVQLLVDVLAGRPSR